MATLPALLRMVLAAAVVAALGASAEAGQKAPSPKHPPKAKGPVEFPEPNQPIPDKLQRRIDRNNEPQQPPPGPPLVGGPNVVWAKPTRAALFGSPIIGAGTVFVACNDGTVQAFAEADGAEVFTVKPFNGIVARPVLLAEGLLVASSHDTITLLDVKDGHEIRKAKLAASARAPLATDGKYVVVVESDGRVEVFTADGLNQVTEHTTGDVGLGAPAVAAGIAVIGDFEGRVFALDCETGVLKWEQSVVGGAIMGEPQVSLSAGVVILGTASGYALGLDWATGTEKWRQIGSGPFIGSGFLAADGSQALLAFGNQRMLIVDPREGKVVSERTLTDSPRLRPLLPEFGPAIAVEGGQVELLRTDLTSGTRVGLGGLIVGGAAQGKALYVTLRERAIYRLTR